MRLAMDGKNQISDLAVRLSGSRSMRFDLLKSLVGAGLRGVVMSDLPDKPRSDANEDAATVRILPITKILVITVWVCVIAVFVFRVLGQSSFASISTRALMTFGIHLPVLLALIIWALKQILKKLEGLKKFKDSNLRAVDLYFDLVGRLAIHLLFAAAIFWFFFELSMRGTK